MLATLLLTENTPIALAGFFLFVVPLMLIIFPISYALSRPKSSTGAKSVAFVLALLPIWAGNGLSDELGAATVLCYLPLGIVFVNLVRSGIEQ